MREFIDEINKNVKLEIDPLNKIRSFNYDDTIQPMFNETSRSSSPTKYFGSKITKKVF